MALKNDWQGFGEYFDGKIFQDLLDYRTLRGETAFKIAAGSGNQKLLKSLLDKVESKKLLVDSLMQEDIHGNTALHEVATTDCVKAAKEMVGIILEYSEKEDQKKLLIKNNLGETPHYRAAALGNTKMLKYFDDKVGFPRDHFHRKDSISILHIAVIGQHFDTAIWILGQDKQLTNEKMNQDGMELTALQLLALMPSAFESYSPMKTRKRFFYSCVPTFSDDDKDYNYKEDLETGKINYCLSYLKKQTGCSKIKEISKEKQKHKNAVELVKLLVKEDNSWEDNIEIKKGEAKKDNPTISLGLGKGSMNKEKKLVDVSAEKLVELLMNKYKSPEAEKDKSLVVSLTEKPIVSATSNDSSTEIQIDSAISKDSPAEKSIASATSENLLTEIPLVFAASNGITEIFNEIIDQYPEAIHYLSNKGENVLHVAIKYRQDKIFKCIIKDNAMCVPKLASRFDNDGNTILHHVANMKLYRGGTRSGPALQYQEELEWFEKVKKILPTHYAMHRNYTRKITASDLFEEKHAQQLKEAQNWIKETAQSCSTLSILMATVVFAAAFTVPGGNNDVGFPNFLHSPLFYVFAVMDVVSLAFSLSSVVMFLSILTSAFEPDDFLQELPAKMTAGFTFLFFSVLTSMVTFSASLLLIIRLDKKWTAALYAVAFLPVIVLALMQFPFYASFVVHLKLYYLKFAETFPRKRHKE